MKTSELKNKTVDELQSELIALFKEQFNLRMQRTVSENNQTHLFRKVRKEIARIKTILCEKEGSSL